MISIRSYTAIIASSKLVAIHGLQCQRRFMVPEIAKSDLTGKWNNDQCSLIKSCRLLNENPIIPSLFKFWA